MVYVLLFIKHRPLQFHERVPILGKMLECLDVCVLWHGSLDQIYVQFLGVFKILLCQVLHSFHAFGFEFLEVALLKIDV